MSRVVVAMSGGVDSSVAAALAADAAGPEAVVGISLRLYSMPDDAVRTGKTCCAPEDMQDARRAADKLGIRFFVYDAQERFRREVIDDFVQSYAAGRTPNPCVKCNDEVKFDWLLDRARKLGAEELVTGHYARIDRGPDGRLRLLRARDASKDQSYFLHGLTESQLATVRFPLGGFTKGEVRAIARERGLPNADKPESMEVCFVGGQQLGDFLEAHGVPRAHGQVVGVDGQPMGEHDGVHRFTVGQRRGLGVSRPLPLYVASIDAAAQRVVVGTREEAQRGAFEARGSSWVHEPPAAGTRCEVQIRHRGKPLPARVECDATGRVRVELDEPAVGVAPGQSAVFYAGDVVLGGAQIEG
jgi:tRNA-specific 2-thiouridylase